MKERTHMKRALLAIVCLAWLAPATPAHAQQSATLVLRTGERISGELVDLGGVGFTIRVNGSERRVPTNDVAVVEFAGESQLPSDMQSKLRSGQQLVRLTNGQIIEGRLADISGTKPLKLTVDTTSGQRDFNST